MQVIWLKREYNSANGVGKVLYCRCTPTNDSWEFFDEDGEYLLAHRDWNNGVSLVDAMIELAQTTTETETCRLMTDDEIAKCKRKDSAILPPSSEKVKPSLWQQFIDWWRALMVKPEVVKKSENKTQAKNNRRKHFTLKTVSGEEREKAAKKLKDYVW